MTYFLARKVGYTVHQAQQIASATWSVDLDPDTEPLRLSVYLNPFSKADAAQLTRARFHALPDTGDELTYALTHGELSFAQEKHYRETVNARLSQLWRQALIMGNPGIFLHYLQDTFAHNGYLSMTGHVFDWPLTKDPTKTFKLLRATELDYLSNDLTAAYAMANQTVTSLRNFMSEYKQYYVNPNNKDEMWDQQPCDPGQVESIVTALAKANPTQTTAEPIWERARDVLEEALHENVPNVIEFDYDSQGNLERAAVNSDFRILKARPAEVISGKWWYVGEKDGIQQMLFARVLDHRFEPSIDFFGGTGNKWTDGVYDATAKEWLLTRKPSLDQIPEHVPGSNIDVPEWVRVQVQGKLEWHLVLRVEGCELLATFYPGLIRWNEQTNEAWVPQGEEGRGHPRKIVYKWYGARVP